MDTTMYGHGARDHELVTLTRAGERAAFDALFGRYLAMVRGEAVRHGLRPVAGDVVQETFLRAYLHLGELDDPGKFASWLRVIARRVCLAELRERDQEQAAVAHLAGQVETQAADTSDLRGLLAQLSPEDREPLHLHYLLGLDTASAAKAMGLQESTYRVRLHRARRRARALAVSLRLEERILMTGESKQDLARRLVAEAKQVVDQGVGPKRSEDWPLFRRKLEEARQADPENGEAAWQLGRKLAKDGEYREATKLLQGLWDRAPGDAWVALTTAWCLDYLGRREEAIRWYARCAAMPHLSETQRASAAAGIEEPQAPKAPPKLPKGLVEILHDGWSATASHEIRPPAWAIDGDITTRWTPEGYGQTPGMWLQLDLGAQVEGVAGLWFDDDVGGLSFYQNDTPRHCLVSVSREGEWWKQVAEWVWQPNHYLEAWWEPIAVRYVKVEQTAFVSPEWWGVFEAHVYRKG